jgi:hypothetical protein
MKRSLLVPVSTLAAILVLAGGAFTQVQKKPDVVGTWIGTAIVDDDGTKVDITVVIDRAEAGYSGKISDTSGLVPESALREIVFMDNKLTCELDLAQAGGTTLIKLDLTLENGALKGAWFDPDGSTGAIELTLKK